MPIHISWSVCENICSRQMISRNLIMTSKCFVFLWIFLLWRHKKSRPCLMTSHIKDTSFCKLFEKDKNHQKNRFRHHNSSITIFRNSRQLHFIYLKARQPSHFEYKKKITVSSIYTCCSVGIYMSRWPTHKKVILQWNCMELYTHIDYLLL